MRFLSTILTAAVAFVSATSAHSILLRAHSRECFHESLHKGDRMTVTFQTGDREFGGSGNLDINFWVFTSYYFSTYKRRWRLAD